MIVSGVLSLLFYSCVINALTFEGESCKLEATNGEGQCIMLHECEYAKKLLREDKTPETCGFSGNVPLVCCPVKQKLVAAKPGKLAQEKCSKYYEFSGAYGGIYMGQKAKSKEFPHMAAVGYVDNEKEILWLCGGTLISNYFVLGAAHCAASLDYGPAKWVRLGDLDLKNTTEDANPQDVRINQTYVHPEYKRSSHYHDIALFKMEKQIYFDYSLKPACLQIENNFPGNDVQATGWGKFDVYDDSTSHLMKVNLRVIDHGTCAKRYANVANGRRLKNGIIDATQICAGNEEGGDTCPGASGGPLHYRVGIRGNVLGHFVIAGVTSFGKGCGGEDSAGVYTRVSAYVGWIENIAWADNVGLPH